MNYSLILVVVVAIVLAMILFRQGKEKFSTSGMAVPDPYCDKLVATYYRPKNNDDNCRDQWGRRICGEKRRNTIDYKTGNYFMHNGMLV